MGVCLIILFVNPCRTIIDEFDIVMQTLNVSYRDYGFSMIQLSSKI